VPGTINGLPLHILLVHAVVVLVPLSALMLVASAVWPAARAKLGFLTPAAALVTLILVPITTHAGHWLRDHLNGSLAQTANVRRHVALGGELLPWAIALFVVATAVWATGRRYDLSWRPADGASERAVPVWVTPLVALVAVVVAVVCVVQVVRIGESGSRAVWTGNFSG
jgi:hypothetical protein